jgi:predicted DNA-binding transcriptional regulator AlpA
MSREGKFPKPIKMGQSKNCAVRSVSEEVEAWIAGRMAERAQYGCEVRTPYRRHWCSLT